MGEGTSIEWAHHTFNPWRGCTKVSAGCTNCYAETLSKRNPAVLGTWGPSGTRVIASEAAWRQPVQWDRKAKAAGERHRVFCASMADVFEDRPELAEPRKRLLQLIDDTPNLDWMLLTKRPENVRRLLLEASNGGVEDFRHVPNVWLGTSVEDQKAADERIPQLLSVRAAVRFLSCEPLLGPVDLTALPWERLPSAREAGVRSPVRCLNALTAGTKSATPWNVSWVIVGGESGPKARPMHPEWARRLRDDCTAAGVPFFFKQWGEWAPVDLPLGHPPPWGPDEINHADLNSSECTVERQHRVGKHNAGRVLDGRTWDEVPRG